MNNEKRCTLSDKELVEKCSALVSKLCKTGGAAWTMRVPVDFDNDSDMLLSELINRFKQIICKPNHINQTNRSFVNPIT